MKRSLYIAAGIVGVHALWIGFADSTQLPFTSICLILGLLFFANVELLKNFKFGLEGIEAETREVIKEARGVTEELKRLAKVLVENQITTIQRNMRLGTYSDSEKETRKEELLETLRSLNIPDAEFPRILEQWNAFIVFDYSHHLLGGSRFPSDFPKDAMEELKELKDRPFDDRPTPDEIRDFFERHGLLDSEKSERIEDYRYFLSHFKHRRPHDFETRDHWFLTR